MPHWRDIAGANVVCVVAHPDDAELMCYGTLRRASEAGAKVSVVIVTFGVNGVSLVDNAVGVRIAEHERVAESASSYAGTQIEISCLGFTDGSLTADHRLISSVEAALAERRCDVLITHSKSANNDHQDHIAVAAAASNAAVRIPTCRMILHGEPHAPRSVFSPNYLVEITDLIK